MASEERVYVPEGIVTGSLSKVFLYNLHNKFTFTMNVLGFLALTAGLVFQIYESAGGEKLPFSGPILITGWALVGLCLVIHLATFIKGFLIGPEFERPHKPGTEEYDFNWHLLEHFGECFSRGELDAYIREIASHKKDFVKDRSTTLILRRDTDEKFYVERASVHQT